MEPRFTDTSLVQSPYYYGHLAITAILDQSQVISRNETE